MADAPIGVFDSGVGGLTVARAILDQLPNESVLYVGDTANGPYGPKPLAAVREHALAIMDDLVEQGVKRLSIPCTPGSAGAPRVAGGGFPAPYGIRVVEVIPPAVRAAVHQTRNRRVGVIGTVATITSR